MFSTSVVVVVIIVADHVLRCPQLGRDPRLEQYGQLQTETCVRNYHSRTKINTINTVGSATRGVVGMRDASDRAARQPVRVR